MIVIHALLLVSIFGIGLYGQTYSPILNPQQVYTAETFCVDEDGVKVGGCPVEFYIDNYYFSNAHYHDGAPVFQQPPVSYFDCIYPGLNGCSAYYDYSIYRWVISATTTTTGDKNVYIALQPTLVGQAEALVTEAGVYSFTNDYAVGYGDLYYTHHPVEWCRVGGSESVGINPLYANHGLTHYNRYMTIDAANGLYDATFNYFASHPGVNHICINDLALPFGGRFDILGNWTNPHDEHDRGGSADVSTVGAAQCAPVNCPVATPTAVDIDDFYNSCLMEDAVAGSSYKEYAQVHVHCAWIDENSYPH